MSQDTEHNKRNAVNFYRIAYEGEPKKAIELYAGSDYRQHNPSVADGPSGFIEYFERMADEYPDKTIEFVRVIAEDDLVALHTHQVWPGDEENVTMYFFDLIKTGKSSSIGMLFRKFLPLH